LWRIEVCICPVGIQIPAVQAALTNKSVIISSQNVSLTNYGAYTGEICAEQLLDLGVKWTLIGHSERRQYYGETSEVVAKKTKNALDKGLSVILCIGEQLSERQANKTFEVLSQQLDAVRSLLSEGDWSRVVIAYEPVWAIGTGQVATPGQAQEAHKYIRGYLNKSVSSGVGSSTRIIYGGSVTDENSGELGRQGDIDGFLVGGASLKPGFAKIVDAVRAKH
jgi:triosephosphate isomerase (TIM)